jgi:adenosylcobinamide kinase/adenosylcobinamide-phosphate guanylyltransferase
LKILFTGGIKSGKSRLAEAYILRRFNPCKPCYLATTEFIDDEMKERIRIHQQRRRDFFTTVEAPLRLLEALQQCPGPVLIECVSMWLNNALHHHIPETEILEELQMVMQAPNDMVLVHNEVGLGVIPANPLARQFADLSGRAAQLMGSCCDEVFFCSAGLTMRMK